MEAGGAKLPITKTSVRTKHNKTTTASQSTHGGCRGKVVGAVVEMRATAQADDVGWNVKIYFSTSSKETVTDSRKRYEFPEALHSGLSKE